MAPEWPPYLAAQVPEFLAENLPYVTEEFRPCLLSADLHAGHVLIEERGGAWHVTGQIDLGDAEVGPVEYEWVPVCQKAFDGNETLMRAFFTTYGWPLPVPPRCETASQALHAAAPVPAVAPAGTRGHGGAVAGSNPRCAVADLMAARARGRHDQRPAHYDENPRRSNLPP